ncbi:hypothetical protein V6N11_004570 [Hibiscus sabdariffa]|uniref:Uncharacterized protein n=1 Tax=Hibiscus sabdariffa TaxID=183260 RepID=A0ABR2SGL9_9ROSI
MMSLECLVVGVDKLWNVRSTVATTKIPVVPSGVASSLVDGLGALTVVPVPHVLVSTEDSACCNEPDATYELPNCNSEPMRDPFKLGLLWTSP